jgi:hypothetical protein
MDLQISGSRIVAVLVLGYLYLVILLKPNPKVKENEGHELDSGCLRVRLFVLARHSLCDDGKPKVSPNKQRL